MSPALRRRKAPPRPQIRPPVPVRAAAARPTTVGARSGPSGSASSSGGGATLAHPSAAAVRPAATRQEDTLRDGRVLRGPQRERHEPDYLILVAVVALAAVGILMIYSSSGIRAALDSQGDLFRAVAPQLTWSGLGIVALAIMSRLDYRYLRLASVPAFLLGLALLVAVLLPPSGVLRPIVVGGSARWLQLGGLQAIHPAELAKLVLVIYLAHWLAKRGGEAGSLLRGTLPFLVICGPVIALVAMEPDLGTTGVITLTAFTMFFVAGASLWQLLVMIPAGVAAVAIYISTNDYQMDRVKAFLDPWKYAATDGFQTVHGLMALAMGGILGAGLGQSRQPGSLPLPNAENDFIFAVVGQEFGLVGGALVICLYVFFAYRGIRVALGAPDTFGALLAIGITAWLTIQALINIGVVVSLLPITGITLPFVSYGGSSLVVSFAAVGILLSISRETQPRGTWNNADPDRGRGYGRPHLPGPGRPTVARRTAP
ncbi:MAG: cell division protein FtsW [Chloroflexota bacterium]|jgi:cell division protein FtsW|nr:cell division protein FtsW [Chloroflexota bacterium]